MIQLVKFNWSLDAARFAELTIPFGTRALILKYADLRMPSGRSLFKPKEDESDAVLDGLVSLTLDRNQARNKTTPDSSPSRRRTPTITSPVRTIESSNHQNHSNDPLPTTSVKLRSKGSMMLPAAVGADSNWWRPDPVTAVSTTPQLPPTTASSAPEAATAANQILENLEKLKESNDSTKVKLIALIADNKEYIKHLDTVISQYPPQLPTEAASSPQASPSQLTSPQLTTPKLTSEAPSTTESNAVIRTPTRRRRARKTANDPQFPRLDPASSPPIAEPAPIAKPTESPSKVETFPVDTTEIGKFPVDITENGKLDEPNKLDTVLSRFYSPENNGVKTGEIYTGKENGAINGGKMGETDSDNSFSSESDIASSLSEMLAQNIPAVRARPPFVDGWNPLSSQTSLMFTPAPFSPAPSILSKEVDLSNCLRCVALATDLSHFKSECESLRRNSIACQTELEAVVESKKQLEADMETMRSEIEALKKAKNDLHADNQLFKNAARQTYENALEQHKAEVQQLNQIHQNHLNNIQSHHHFEICHLQNRVNHSAQIINRYRKLLQEAKMQRSQPPHPHPQSLHPQSPHSQTTHPESPHPQLVYPESPHPQSVYPESPQPQSAKSPHNQTSAADSQRHSVKSQSVKSPHNETSAADSQRSYIERQRSCEDCQISGSKVHYMQYYPNKAKLTATSPAFVPIPNEQINSLTTSAPLLATPPNNCQPLIHPSNPILCS